MSTSNSKKTHAKHWSKIISSSVAPKNLTSVEEARRAKKIKDRRDAEEAARIEKFKAKRESDRDIALAKGYASKANNAGLNGKYFALSFEEYKRVMIEPKCAYTGVSFGVSSGRTLERVNPAIGYVNGNVLAVTKEANCHKSKLDSFMHETTIPMEMKLKLLRKAAYQLEKALKGIENV